MVTFTCQELDLVRRGHSFASHRTEASSSSSGQSVSVSNSVSHVRVEVGDPVLGFLSVLPLVQCREFREPTNAN